jgi:hypothetical protein
MSDKPEALRLAAFLDDQYDPSHNLEDAADELRRLYQFAEDQIGRATAAEASLQMTKATHALKIAAVESQRDALLEALTNALPQLVGPRREEARAAIKAMEKTK